MTKTELLELIKNGESSGVEFKRDTEETEKLAKELVALAPDVILCIGNSSNAVSRGNSIAPCCIYNCHRSGRRRVRSKFVTTRPQRDRLYDV